MTVGVFLTTGEEKDYTIFDSVFHAIDYTREMGNFLAIRVIQSGESKVVYTPLKDDEYWKGVKPLASAYVEVISEVIKEMNPFNLVTAGKPKLDNILFGFEGFEPYNVPNQMYIDKLMMDSASNTLSLKERELFLQTSFMKRYFGTDDWFTALTKHLD